MEFEKHLYNTFEKMQRMVDALKNGSIGGGKITSYNIEKAGIQEDCPLFRKFMEKHPEYELVGDSVRLVTKEQRMKEIDIFIKHLYRLRESKELKQKQLTKEIEELEMEIMNKKKEFSAIVNKKI